MGFNWRWWEKKVKEESDLLVGETQELVLKSVTYSPGFVHVCGEVSYLDSGDYDQPEPYAVFCRRCGTTEAWRKVVLKITHGPVVSGMHGVLYCDDEIEAVAYPVKRGATYDEEQAELLMQEIADSGDRWVQIKPPVKREQPEVKDFRVRL